MSADSVGRVFEGDAGNVGAARHWLDGALADAPWPGVPDDIRATAALLLSEAATNAIAHTLSGHGGKFAVEALTWPGAGRLYVEVEDDGGTRGRPRVVDTPPDATGGHGLALMDAFAWQWCDLEPPRTGVCFFLRWPTGPAPG